MKKGDRMCATCGSSDTCVRVNERFYCDEHGGEAMAAAFKHGLERIQDAINGEMPRGSFMRLTMDAEIETVEDADAPAGPGRSGARLPGLYDEFPPERQALCLKEVLEDVVGLLHNLGGRLHDTGEREGPMRTYAAQMMITSAQDELKDVLGRE